MEKIYRVNGKWSLSQLDSKDYSCVRKKGTNYKKCKDKQYLNADHNLATNFCSPCFYNMKDKLFT